MEIEKLLTAQRSLQDSMGNPMGTNRDSSVKENMLALIVEATEVLAEVNWKPWKKQQKIVDEEALLLELVDILQFWANAVNACGYTHEDILAAYDRKIVECYARIERAEVRNG